MLDYKANFFLQAARTLNISQTARDLHISQPAVTAAIQKLEEQVGVKLFYRYSRGLRLTPAGSSLYQRLQELKTFSVQVENEMMLLRQDVHGHLNLGASSTIGEYILPGLLERFHSRFPQIRFSLRVGNNQRIYKDLWEGKIELGFLAGNVPGKRFEVKKIMDDEMVFIASPRHPWGGCMNIEAGKLLLQPLIVREQGSGSRRDMEAALSDLGLVSDKLNVIAEFNSLEAIKSAVEAGLGLALISRWAISKELQLKTLSAYKIMGATLTRNIYMAVLKEAELTESASRFFRTIPELVTTLRPEK